MFDPIVCTDIPLDADGRVQIPLEIIRVLGWKDSEKLEVFILDPATRTVGVRPELMICSLCGNQENLTEFRGGLICGLCMKQIRKGRFF